VVRSDLQSPVQNLDAQPKAVDVVYTWVDDSDPSFRDALRRYAFANGAEVDPDAARLYRFRNNGELRFSLRSLLAFAPWVRRIHILTNGQVPDWLDRSDPRIHLVTHAQVFPEPEVLPTFNSNAIEMCLHRIPDLAPRFVYFNDDVFLGRPVRETDFFLAGGGQKVLLQDTLLPGDYQQGSARDRACAYTQTILTRLWGPPQARRLLTAHSPQAYDRDRLAHLETLLQDEFRRTAAHRFRSANDLVLSILYAYTLRQAPAEQGRHQFEVLSGLSTQCCFLMLEHNPLWVLWAFAYIWRKQPKFFCINDDLGNVSPQHPLLMALRAFLQLYLERSAPVERANEAVRRE
jgi:hypothetical protein